MISTSSEIHVNNMQSFPSVPAGPGGQRNYVFVDEHNRHKRLKVMRACEGCRRRKIKCDSATTNTWPCAACTRLKLICVPPPSGGENDETDQDDYAATDSTEGVSFQNVIPLSSPHGSALKQDYQDHIQSHFYPSSGYLPPQQYQGAGSLMQPTTAYPHMYRNMSDASTASLPRSASITQTDAGLERVVSNELDYSTAEGLIEQLGDLKIGENGVALFTRPKDSFTAEPEAPIQDTEIKLPPLSTGAGSQIRIPPELMPSDQEASQYFQLFFRDIHPYVPVINRNFFYHQWHTNRAAISPLLLEAVFACAGRMSDDPAQGAQWLALANKHESSFLEAPRLSTLQSLLLLLKAREAAPKQGYYYRSWMTCKTVVSMAKDLDLHEHHDIHASGEHCGSDDVECLTKTRVWQTILICEMMIGGTQGRSDMGVDPNTVETSTNPPGSDLDDYEKALSRQFAFFVRNAFNIRLITDLSHKLKKKKEWGLDPEFVAHNVAFKKWPSELPKDLQLPPSQDSTPLSLPSHFIGNMHSHYQLGNLMLHRPQLVASKSFALDQQWKQQMSICYNSAKMLCRIQEAILAKFSIIGLMCMQRGINFTIYAILTCTMVHLIAVTSPDPDFNTDARDFFTRHMRILEKCVSAWPQPEMEAQINALRLAFSANVNKPFELKISFPYGSPSEPYSSSPPTESPPHQISMSSGHGQQLMPQPSSSYMTPPISAQGTDSKPESPQYNQYMPPDNNYAQMGAPQYQQQSFMNDQSQWNPTPIIMQFNAAFSIPQSQLQPPRSHSFSQGQIPQMQQQPQMQPSATQIDPYARQYLQQLHQATSMTSAPPAQAQAPQQQPQQLNYGADEAVFVTPRDWQQSVASVFNPGMKRRYDMAPHIDETMQKRMR